VLERGLPGHDRIDVEAALAEAIAQEYGGIFVIIDDQDGSIHSELFLSTAVTFALSSLAAGDLQQS